MIETPVQELRKGDTVWYDATRHNVIAAIREERDPFVSYTLRLQVPGTPVVTLRDLEPSEIFLRIEQ